MAKIYPENLITHRTRTPSEEKFLRSVREKLSDEWTVFVNLEYTSAPDFRRVSGEIDFLLFHEIFGIVIAEVKGGTLSSELGGEHWLQGSRPCKKDPWAQAQSQKKFLLRYFHANYGVAYLPFAVAALPCFPDCAFREEFPPETRGNALWADDIEGDLEAFLVNFLRNSRDRSQVVHAAEFFDTALLRCALQSLFETAEKLRDRSKEERSVLLKLTHEQGRALNAESCGRRRFRVCGSVGTGKTLIALEQAKRLAAQGESVLLLCYNILLSEFLISSVQAFPNVVAAAFSDFACDALGISEEEREAAAKKNEAGRDAFFDGLPKKLCAFLQKFPRKFDAVIIDEAQDFSEDMWRAVESLTRDDGRFIVFYDENEFSNTATRKTFFGKFRNACRTTRKFSRDRPKASASKNFSRKRRRPRAECSKRRCTICARAAFSGTRLRFSAHAETFGKPPSAKTRKSTRSASRRRKAGSSRRESSSISRVCASWAARRDR